MTDYREILRLRSLGINHSQIALSMGISRQTVVTVLQRAGVLHVDWQTAEGISDQELARRLFPPNEGKIEYKMPDYAYIHREMAKPGMTQQLLWFEYYDQCRNSVSVKPSHVFQCSTSSKENGSGHLQEFNELP